MRSNHTKKEGNTTMLLSVLIAAALMLLVMGGALADEFSYNRLEKEWTYIAPYDTLPLPVFEFDRQEGRNNHGAKLLRAADGEDWAIETRILRDTLKGHRGYHGGLCAYVDERNYLIFGANGATKVALQGMIGGQALKETFVMNGDRYFKMRKSGAVYTFEYSADGEEWTAFKRDFTDDGGALKNAEIGLMNRYLYVSDLFHSANKSLESWFIEYAYFRVDGTDVPFSMAGENGWRYEKSCAVFAMPVLGGSISLLLRDQKDSDWAIDGRLIYTSMKQGYQDGVAGITLYVDENNYLLLGVRGAFANKTRYEVGGKIGGVDTGTLATFTGRGGENRTLRVLRRTQTDGSAVYHFYVCDSGDEYAFIHLAAYRDDAGTFASARYGLMGMETSGDADFMANYEFFSECAPDGYSDYFLQTRVDGQWLAENADDVRAGNGYLHLKAEAGRIASLTRAPIDDDWTMDATLERTNGGLSGLIVGQGERMILFGVRDGAITLVNSLTGETAALGEAYGDSPTHLRAVKRGQEYRFYSSQSGLAWREEARVEDASGALAGARYGLGVMAGDGAAKGSYAKFYEGRVETDNALRGIASLSIPYALTGENSPNKTQSRWGFGGGDLGSMFEHDGTVYMLYGDTFSGDRITGDWIHNALSVGVSPSPAEGVLFSDLYMGKAGNGLVLPTAPDYACAMIPSCGFALKEAEGVALYGWFHEIYGWQTGGHRDVEGAGWAVSRDGGKTWTYARQFDGNSPFQFVTCWREGDTLYMYGNSGGGYGEVYLMKTDVHAVLNTDSYAYFKGVDQSGAPCWSPDARDAAIVLDYCEREIGVTYNAYLKRYLMTGWDSFNGQMVIHTAERLHGPWSAAVTLLNRQYTPTVLEADRNTAIYGAYTLPSMIEDGGKTMYFTLSEYSPYQVYWMRVEFEGGE